ncbi:porin [Prevotella lacticifex]|nr:porin [Prevotella lacticifex]
MRKYLALLLLSAMTLTAGAQTPKWVNNVKLSGYGMTQYQYVDKKNAKSNSFNLRLARISLDGRVLSDWYWKAQIQFNGNTSNLGSSPKVVDLFVEWQHFDWLRIKMGQFKNPFSYENPMNPLDQGFMSYSQIITQLTNFTGRDGSHSSNGRDIGLQFQGDFLKNSNGRNLLHYQVGVFNGQGINVKDVDQQKNVIGGVWVMPVKGMRLGWFGWTGSYARKGAWTDPDGSTHSGVRSLQQRRYAFSAEYLKDDWTFRTEYAHQTGYGFKNRYQDADEASSNNADINYTNGDKAQGVYALVIAPVIKNKFHAKARYDMYQPSGDASLQKTNYEVGLDYMFTKNILLSGEYCYTHDRGSADHDYNTIDIQVSYRF